jgi:hypothetical protein
MPFLQEMVFVVFRIVEKSAKIYKCHFFKKWYLWFSELWKNRLSSFAFFGGFFKWGPNIRIKALIFSKIFQMGAKSSKSKLAFFLPKNPKKKRA